MKIQFVNENERPLENQTEKSIKSKTDKWWIKKLEIINEKLIRKYCEKIANKLRKNITKMLQKFCKNIAKKTLRKFCELLQKMF